MAHEIFWVSTGVLYQKRTTLDIDIEYSWLSRSFIAGKQKILSAKKCLFWPFFDKKSYFSLFQDHLLVWNHSIFWKFSLSTTHFHPSLSINARDKGEIFFSHPCSPNSLCILNHVIERRWWLMNNEDKLGDAWDAYFQDWHPS